MLRCCLVLAMLLLAATPGLGNDHLRFNDPLHEQQWYLAAMRFDTAWAQLKALDVQRETVVIAVVDSGFDLDHPDLPRNMLPGINIADGGKEIGPLTAHGTGTIGPIGAISNNALGISQAAWTARVLPIRVTNRTDGRARTADIAAAIRRAADEGAHVINVSYGGVQLDTIDAAGRYAQQCGAVVIMPAGNEGEHHTDWKRQPHVFAVGALLRNGERAPFSNHGAFVDFVAPGQRVTSLYPGEGYARWDGTSFASPLVASAAALVMAANPTLTPGQVYDVLRLAATDDGHRHPDTLPGVIDAARAVELALAMAGEQPLPSLETVEPAGRSAVAEEPLQVAAAAAEADLLQEPQGFVSERLGKPLPR